MEPSFWGCLHFWGWLNFLGRHHFWGRFHLWGRRHFWAHLQFWGPLHFRDFLHFLGLSSSFLDFRMVLRVGVAFIAYPWYPSDTFRLESLSFVFGDNYLLVMKVLRPTDQPRYRVQDKPLTHTGCLKKKWDLFYYQYIHQIKHKCAGNIFHFKGGFHSSVLSTKKFLYNIRELRYKPIETW